MVTDEGDETLRLIGCLSGTHRLMAKLIYGSGVRLWAKPKHDASPAEKRWQGIE